jgi:hypothetical protein
LDVCGYDLKEILGISIWVSGMAYSALAIGIPEIRPNWHGTSTRLGAVSSVGVAWFFWGIPVLALAGWMLGITSLTLAWLLFCCVAVVIFTSGYLMDVFDSRK